jgi:hypothetical protein
MAYVVAFQASYLSTRRHECRVKSDLKSNNNKRSLFESHSTARLSDLWEFVSGSFTESRQPLVTQDGSYPLVGFVDAEGQVSVP